jgi:hypothetical protein
MAKEIYNKNAREAHLMAEAYSQVNEGHSDSELHPATRAAEGMIGADVMWDGQRKRGIVDEVDIERGIAVVTDHEGNEHVVDLGDFDVVLDPNTETPGDLKHHYGIEDQEFNELENKRERARDRGREAEDKGDWDEWNKQENEREGAKDALRGIEDAEKWDGPGMQHDEPLEPSAEVAVTAEDGLAAMDLFYKVLKGQSDAFAEMTDEQEAKYENLEALIRDELMYPL